MVGFFIYWYQTRKVDNLCSNCQLMIEKKRHKHHSRKHSKHIDRNSFDSSPLDKRRNHRKKELYKEEENEEEKRDDESISLESLDDEDRSKSEESDEKTNASLAI